jgi:hypothetical protein
VDGEGNIIVADFTNHRVLKIAQDGTVSTLAGAGLDCARSLPTAP